MLDWHVGLPGACCCAGRQYRWRAGLVNASLSVGLKRLIYSLKYRAKRPGQSRVRRKGERRVEQQRDRGSLDVGEGPLAPSPPSLFIPFSCLFCLLLNFLGLPEAITAVYGRRPAGWHLLEPDRLPLGICGGGSVEWKSDWL